MALILIHEFGHFIIAKAMGVRVNEFAIGFGPKLLSKQARETRYSLNLIPLGGYCAMEGEDSESDDEKAFCRKKPWRRFLIVAAGVVFNLVLGLVLVAITLIPSKNFSTTTVAEFAKDSVSSQHGLQVNDKIIEIDGRKIYTTYDMSYAFTSIDDGMVDITVMRNGKENFLRDVKFDTENHDNINYISVDFWVYGQKKTVASFISQTFKMTFSYVRVVWFSLIDLIGGRFGLNAISGPVGVTAAVGNAARQSLSNLFPIMALITINLGIFNLLPLPALDGGRLVIILFEMIFKKPVPQKIEGIIHASGFIILIIIMMFITFKDIWKLIVR